MNGVHKCAYQDVTMPKVIIQKSSIKIDTKTGRCIRDDQDAEGPKREYKKYRTMY